MFKEEKRNTANFNNGSKVFKIDDAKKFDNNEPKKPLRYSEDALTKKLENKKIRVTLINNNVIEGILVNLGVYDLTIRHKVKEQFGTVFRESDKDIIILKATIITVEVM